MGIYQDITGNIGSLLRQIKEDESQSPLKTQPANQPSSPIRQMVVQPLTPPESPGSSQIVGLRPEGGVAPGSPQAASLTENPTPQPFRVGPMNLGGPEAANLETWAAKTNASQSNIRFSMENGELMGVRLNNSPEAIQAESSFKSGQPIPGQAFPGQITPGKAKASQPNVLSTVRPQASYDPESSSGGSSSPGPSSGQAPSSNSSGARSTSSSPGQSLGTRISLSPAPIYTAQQAAAERAYWDNQMKQASAPLDQLEALDQAASWLLNNNTPLPASMSAAIGHPQPTPSPKPQPKPASTPQPSLGTKIWNFITGKR